MNTTESIKDYSFASVDKSSYSHKSLIKPTIETLDPIKNLGIGYLAFFRT